MLAITASLSKAIKTIIDTPILSESGELTETSQESYQNINGQLPKFDRGAVLALQGNYEAKPITNEVFRKKQKRHKLATASLVLGIVSFALIITVFLPFITVPIGIILGIKGTKTKKTKTAIAGIINHHNTFLLSFSLTDTRRSA